MMEELLDIVQKAIDEKKGSNPLVYEFTQLNPFIEHVVICSAASVRQTHAIAQHIKECVKEQGYDVRSVEGNSESQWLLVDLNSVVVHVFVDEEREHLKLEKLYADLPVRDFSL